MKIALGRGKIIGVASVMAVWLGGTAVALGQTVRKAAVSAPAMEYAAESKGEEDIL